MIAKEWLTSMSEPRKGPIGPVSDAANLVHSYSTPRVSTPKRRNKSESTAYRKIPVKFFLQFQPTACDHQIVV